MDAYWQVIIGAGIGGAIYSLYSLYKQYVAESRNNNESQTLATISICVGLSGIVLVGVGSLLGAAIAFYSMQGKKNKALSKIGLFVSVLSFIPWLLVLVFGA